MTEASLPPEAADSGQRKGYAQILRASALIGGASALSLGISILRTKVLAVLLGPAGIGLLGVLTSVSDLARSVAQLGINGSGVRQIAESVASNDVQRIARTVTVLRRVSVLLGLLGMLSLIVCSGIVAEQAFGNRQHAASVAWLSLAVFFRLVADGQAALFQGMRRIADLAQIGVLGALGGAMVSIALAALFGEAGVVPGLIATAALSVLISWRRSRTVQVRPVGMTGGEVRDETVALLKLGFAFMASALLMTGAAFAVRTIVLRHGGVDDAGLYQAAWTLGGMYVGFVLQAMGTDFYPRLVGVIEDPIRTNCIVNEQSQVSLLLAGPGVIATLVFASPALNILYTAQFAAATEALRWICLGMALRVITWPMGYIVLAMNRRLVFFATELAWTTVNVGLSWACITQFGLIGAGIAFFGSYVFHGFMIYAVVRRMKGFRWSRQTWWHGWIFVSSVVCVFLGCILLPSAVALAVGVVVLLASTWYTATTLSELAPELVPAVLRRWLTPKAEVAAASQ
jgi:enterobacterial common antigen flippase